MFSCNQNLKVEDEVLMIKNIKVTILSVLLSGSMLGLTSCSMSALKQYPGASEVLFQNAESKNGISVVAKLLLEEESKEYFGINLLDNGIYAVHLTIRNDNPENSYIVSVESEQVNDPSSGTKQVGEGVVLISFLVGVKLLSDATIIKENFEAKKLRTATIDPGEKISGFSYYKWEGIKEIDTLHICLNVANPIINISFPYCLDVTIN